VNAVVVKEQSVELTFTSILNVGIGLGSLVLAVLKFSSYRAARKTGVSRSDYILATAGGAEALRKKAATERKFALGIMLLPLILIVIPAERRSDLLILAAIFELFFVPLGLLLLWDSKRALKIAEKATQRP